MRLYLGLLAGAQLLLSGAFIHSALALTQDEIAGTWTVVSVVHEEQSGKKTTPLGEHPRGVLIIGRDGRFTAVLVAQGRAPLQNEGSMAELTQSVVAYSALGSAQADPNNSSGLKVTLTPEVSWNPATTGNSDVRFVTLDGNRLVLKSTSSGGTETQVYERSAR